ncbi:LysR family transcriptional regulator [Bosea vestrisii]|uniref:LysR family transcriptional regulator n=1 Tax=Bosea vestrisii TaxID=151416 RepID=UPI0024E02E98|nr:LysR family transcriptional regulator [Bosea vestrisii]WID97320.1 LysR family transcriptional regulator [Bosea vestrisii]
MSMDSEALETFVTIHHANGFSRAAEILGRSQPAISRRIALLEGELGVPVFERAAGGVVLSEAGGVLLPHAERVLAALRDAQSAIEAMRTGDAGHVALVTVGTLAGSNLTAVLKRFTADHPGIDLSISTATSAEVSELVRRGEAMIGLRYLLDVAPDLVCEHIASETMAVACAPEHPFAGTSLASMSALRDERWFAFRNAYDLRESFADNIFAQFQACGIGEIRWTPVDSLNAMKRLVEAGLGLALLPESAIEEELRTGSLATIVISDLKVANPVYAVIRRGGYLSPATLNLLSLLRSEAGLVNRSTVRDANRPPQAARLPT